MYHVKNHPALLRRVPATEKILDSFFHQGLNQFFGTDVENSIPSANVLEAKDHYELQIAAPGFQKDDFQIELNKDSLSISVSKEQEETSEEKTFRRREFSYRKFSRSFRLSNKINAEGIAARYEQGILYVTLPKKEEATAALKKITIA